MGFAVIVSVFMLTLHLKERRRAAQPAAVLLHHFSGISSFSSSSCSAVKVNFGSGSSSGSTGGAAGAGAAAAAPLPDGAGDAGCVGGAAATACFGGGMRTRSAGPILPRISTIVGNTAMTLLAQPAVSSPKAPRKVRLLVLLSTKAALVVGEPDHQLRFLVVADPNSSSVTVLMRNFFSRFEIGSLEDISTCRSQTLTAPLDSSFELRLQGQFGGQPIVDVCSSSS